MSKNEYGYKEEAPLVSLKESIHLAEQRFYSAMEKEGKESKDYILAQIIYVLSDSIGCRLAEVAPSSEAAKNAMVQIVDVIIESEVRQRGHQGPQAN